MGITEGNQTASYKQSLLCFLLIVNCFVGKKFILYCKAPNFLFGIAFICTCLLKGLDHFFFRCLSNTAIISATDGSCVLCSSYTENESINSDFQNRLALKDCSVNMVQPFKCWWVKWDSLPTNHL